MLELQRCVAQDLVRRGTQRFHGLRATYGAHHKRWWNDVTHSTVRAVRPREWQDVAQDRAVWKIGLLLLVYSASCARNGR